MTFSSSSLVDASGNGAFFQKTSYVSLTRNQYQRRRIKTLRRVNIWEINYNRARYKKSGNPRKIITWVDDTPWSSPELLSTKNRKFKNYWNSSQKMIFERWSHKRTHKKTPLSRIRGITPPPLTSSNWWSVSRWILSPGLSLPGSHDNTEYRANTGGLQKMSYHYLDATSQHDSGNNPPHTICWYEL